MTFQRRHYEYLADTIINDPDITEHTRTILYAYLGSYLKRDFPNFNQNKWSKKWQNHFHSDLNSPVQRNVLGLKGQKHGAGS